ncbi:hypothetical protein FGLOB1_1918 [Fusarium globosum]|uniref:Uncharacterized protein n=1 Tax=Fusarium globosum TaxID=78864 RepID=A0A8H6DIB2_9HYPO|nr:hypothetical protein FGLOB1_1918 [Fusarium globosum]
MAPQLGSPELYTIAWIAALPIERAAATALLGAANYYSGDIGCVFGRKVCGFTNTGRGIGDVDRHRRVALPVRTALARIPSLSCIAGKERFNFGFIRQDFFDSQRLLNRSAVASAEDR